MKRLTIILATTAAAILTGAAAVALNAFKPMTDNDPAGASAHALTSLWDEFAKEQKADKPKSSAAVLAKIKEEASSRRLHADYYDAVIKYADVMGSVNWKTRDSLSKAARKEIYDYDEPIVTFTWMVDRGSSSSYEAFKYASKEKERLSAASTPYFHYGISSVMGGAMSSFVENDYEYTLWRSLLTRSLSYDNPTKDEVYSALSEYLGDRYPGKPYLEYYAASKKLDSVSKGLMEELVKKYSGKAVSFWPRQELLMIRKRDLDRSKASSNAYKALYNDCLAYEKEREALKGDERKIALGCVAVSSLIETLTAKDISAEVVDGKIVVSFTNLDKAEVKLYSIDPEGKKIADVAKWKVENKTCSFYLTDTEKVDLPRVDDGRYRLDTESGSLSYYRFYRQFSLSFAESRDNGYPVFYVADAKSGKPCNKVDLTLFNGTKTVASANVGIDGFTRMPEEFHKALLDRDEKVYRLVASYRDSDGFLHSTDRHSAGYFYDYGGTDLYSSVRCNIYKDQGAYNPGDIMKYKVVLFKGNLVNKMDVLPEGSEIEVTVSDAESNTVYEKKLKTNAFGSIADEVSLPTGSRNGMFSMRVRYNGSTIDSDSFRVDEFVLPTFTATFDKNDKLYFPGDEITCSGRIISYSGHKLSSATIVAVVSRWGSEKNAIEVKPESDGTFKFPFRTESSGWYDVMVTITDATGETQSYSTGYYVADRIRISISLKNGSNGSVILDGTDSDYVKPFLRTRKIGERGCGALLEDKAVFKVDVLSSDGVSVPIKASYKLLDEEGNVLEYGMSEQGQELTFDLSKYPSGAFVLKAEAFARNKMDETISADSEFDFVKVDIGSDKLDAPVKRLVIFGDETVENGEKMKVYVGVSDNKPLWGVAFVSGENGKFLESIPVHLAGKRNQAGSLACLSFEYKASYPDAVRLNLFWFRDGRSYSTDREFHRVRHSLELPLSYSLFEDRTRPATEYTFRMKTAPETEAVAAIYDKSLDAIARNVWNKVYLREFSVSHVGFDSTCGYTNCDGYDDSDVRDGFFPRLLSKAAGGMVVERAAPMMMEDRVAVEEAVDYESNSAEAPKEETPANIQIRKDFATSLSFQPFLRSDKDGLLEFSFKTSDKLSTYYVSVYAHDKNMRNELISKEMMVTIPVKVSVVEPGFLYEGDKYILAASVSSNAGKKVSGTLSLDVYNGTDYKTLKPVKTFRKALSLGDGDSVGESFPIDVPSGVDTLGFKIVFSAGEFSDAVFVPVKVLKAEQDLLEAHSGVLLAGADREALIKELKSRFVNADPEKAEFKEISIIDMIREAIPEKIEPERPDVLSLSEAWYCALLSAKLRGEDATEQAEELLKKILACRNSDGGFGWFEGMDSSQSITAVILERAAIIAAAGFTVPDLTSSVEYLDKRQFGVEFPEWCGWISDTRYMYVRSMYPHVPFKVGPVNDKKLFKERMKEFKDDAKHYLTPKDKEGRGLQGAILPKARRLKTLRNLASCKDGVSLAKAWGVKGVASKKLVRSAAADVVSLSEYAVDHRDGCIYYPNAVMPWRGLLENEAYAHSLLADLFADASKDEGKVKGSISKDEADRLADGLRIWLMLQKETQKWDEDPAFVNAIASVLNGSEKALQTKVLVFKSEVTAPFNIIKESGNGFTVSRTFIRELDGKEIAEGDQVKKGDRIIIRYDIWNAENRSFIRIVAPREAAFRPVNQLSGRYGWWLRPLTAGWYTFSPQGYRNVKNERTEYYFDTYPEEKTSIEETFFVTQSGTFTAPVVTIESLYANHYRANAAWHGLLTVE
ncbi:MAG: hypothetical protein IKP46_02530 [Bacteroidales bacterium]|nr:hypothetical protein [Bacteroidales bacterium]